MPLIQFIFTLIIFVAFFITLFIIAWYVAVPLLMIWAILGGLKWIQMRIRSYRNNRQANGCTMRRTSHSYRDKATVIDVDYTELN